MLPEIKVEFKYAIGEYARLPRSCYWRSVRSIIGISFVALLLSTIFIIGLLEGLDCGCYGDMYIAIFGDN